MPAKHYYLHLPGRSAGKTTAARDAFTSADLAQLREAARKAWEQASKASAIEGQYRDELRAAVRQKVDPVVTQGLRIKLEGIEAIRKNAEREARGLESQINRLSKDAATTDGQTFTTRSSWESAISKKAGVNSWSEHSGIGAGRGRVDAMSGGKYLGSWDPAKGVGTVADAASGRGRGFTGYVNKSKGGVDLMEGSGTYGGLWAIKTGGRIVAEFGNRRDAVNHAKHDYGVDFDS